MLLTVEMWGGKKKTKVAYYEGKFPHQNWLCTRKIRIVSILIFQKCNKNTKKKFVHFLYCIISTVINYPFFFLVFWVILTFLINRFYIWIGNVLCKQTRIVFTIDVCVVKDIIIHFTGFMSMLVLDQWSHYQNRNN